MAVVISERLLDGTDRLLDAESDEQLVRLVQAGRDAAFAAIVRRYERELKAQAARLTSDGRAEDAVQQAFLNAFAALRGGSEVRHLRGWLHHILRNEVTRARVPLEAPLDATAIYGETLEETVQLRAAAHATLAHLSDLPERQRDALLGTAVLGFPRAHVARTMGLSEGAVRQLVHRARLRLRQAASALIPFPLVKLFGAARSGVDAAPDAALGAGTAASGGLAIKVGALVASGVVATGIAVTRTFPAHHRSAPVVREGRDHVARSRAATHGAARGSGPSVAPGDAAVLTNSARLREHGPATASTKDGSQGGPGRLFGTRSGRHGGSGSSGGRRDGGRGEDGSGGTPGRGRDGSGTSSGSRSGSGPSADGGGSGSGRSGSGSAGDRGGSGSRQGSTTTLTGTSGSGSGDGGGSRDGGSNGTGGDGSGTSTEGGSSSGSTQGSSGSATTPLATATTDTSSGASSGGGGGSDGGTSGGSSSDGGSSGGGSSDGGQESSGGSRDVSGSLHSSSS